MASVKQSWIKKYGEKEGLRKWEIQKKKYGRTKEQHLKEKGKSYVDNLSKKKSTFRESHYVEKFGKEEGQKKWQEVLNKKLVSQKQTYDKVGFKNGATLEEYQTRHGIEEGYKLWKKKNQRHSYNVSLQRYIDEFGEIKGRETCYKIKDNVSLKSFIERYGETEGKKRWNEFRKKTGITEEKMIDTYGKELGREKYRQWLLNVTEASKKLRTNAYSKISQELFWNVYDCISDEMKEKCYFAELNKEFRFFLTSNERELAHKKMFCVDFKVNDVIIEYDNDYYHNKDDDSIRDSILSKKGYRIIRINDKEYSKNKLESLKQCLEAINERT